MSGPPDANALLAAADERQLSGDLAGAIALYDRLLALDPFIWPAYANRGLARAVAGDGAAARADFRRALTVDPCAGPALRNLADSLQTLAPASALIPARALVALAPMAADSWLSLGAAALGLGRSPVAARALRRAAVLAPSLADCLTGLGVVAAATDRIWFERALAIAPDLPPLLALARHSHALHDRRTAWRHLRRALALAPGSAEVLLEVTMVIEDAETLHRWAYRAHLFAPDSPAILNNLGTAAVALGRLEEAERCFAAAIRHRADFAEAHFNRATPLFLLGRMGEAWGEYEWRWRVDRFETPPTDAPRWGGEDLRGRRLLVHEEQGLGDTLQFVRYLPLLATRHRNLAFLCHPRLAHLLQESFPAIEIHARPALPPHEVAAPLLSLPLLLGEADHAPPAAPYLKRPTPHGIDAQGRLRIGLVWSGNPAHPRNRERSIPLAQLSSWLAIPGIAWFSMLFGPGTADIAEAGFETRLADLGSSLPDLRDVAAALAGLDLLISVDTAFCHLAGALGLPVWTMLAQVPDWRWGMKGAATPWYPSMRLFRQPARGAWQPVVAEVEAALVALKRAKPPNI